MKKADKKKNNIYCYSGDGHILIKNVVKRGMDSSKFINMVICYPDPDQYIMDDCPVPPNMFFIHDITFSEALGVLINKFGMNETNAKSIIRKWIDLYNIQRIRVDQVPEAYEGIVRAANKKVVQRLGSRFKIGDKDVKILAGFLKEGINIVHVADKGFEETCREFSNMNIVPTLKRDLEKERKIKESLGK